jgi:hypothetical protein
MADLNLGNAPGTLTVTLVRGADFASGIDSLDGDWPSGTVIRLVFNDRAHTAWTAALNGAEANWNIDKAAVNALIGGDDGVGASGAAHLQRRSHRDVVGRR